jgi:hypothetical protein
MVETLRRRCVEVCVRASLKNVEHRGPPSSTGLGLLQRSKGAGSLLADRGQLVWHDLDRDRLLSQGLRTGRREFRNQPAPL